MKQSRSTAKSATPQFRVTLTENEGFAAPLAERAAFSSKLKEIVAIPGPPGPPGADGAPGLPNVIQDEGTPLTVRAALNFTGAGVTAADDAANGRTVVTIPGAAAAPVSSVFTRTGAIVAVATDYTPAFIGAALAVHAHAAADITTGVMAVARLGTGTPSASNYLRGDGAWTAVAAGAAQTPWTSDIDAAGFSLNNAGRLDIASPGTLGTHYAYAALRIHEATRAGYAGADPAYAPRLTLEWPGVSIAQLGLLNDGSATIRTLNANGDGYVPFRCSHLITEADVNIGPWPRTAVISVPADGAADSGAFVISTRNLGTLAERMRVSAAGKVGMGKSPTTYALEVSGDIDVTGNYRKNGVVFAQTPWTATVDAADFSLTNVHDVVLKNYLQMKPVGGAPIDVICYNYGGGMDWLIDGASRLYVTPTGVGIGVVPPSYKLDVAGDIRATGAQIILTGLPSTAPGAGSKRLWYDPADSNRVKYVP